MPVPNFTLVGSPTTNPNWIAPGLEADSYSPYLLSNGGNVAPCFWWANCPVHTEGTR